MAPHSSTLAWKILWTEEPGGLPSMGSHRVRHDWSDLAVAVIHKASPSLNILGDCVLSQVKFKVNYLYFIKTGFFGGFCCCCCIVAQSCPTVCDPMDSNPPGSSVHGISQARKLKWVAISFSRGEILLRWRQILYHWVTREALGGFNYPLIFCDWHVDDLYIWPTF